ncbi:MAG: NTP transferase domain-containing protein [Patescibacteria group bacterium]
MTDSRKNFTGVILAAGKGDRLEQKMCKALVEVAGYPLLQYQLNFLQALGAKEIVVVTGCQGEDVARLAKRLLASVRVASNKEFQKKGNLPGLLAAFEATDASVLVMNVDHLYLASKRMSVTTFFGETISVFCDFKEKLDPDERGILLGEDRYIKKIDKHLDRWDCGCVGLTYIPASRREAYLRAIPATLEKLGDDTGYENVLQTLADTGEQVAVADVSGICPIEIDYPEELVRARAVVAEDPAAFGIARI